MQLFEQFFLIFIGTLFATASAVLDLLLLLTVKMLP